MNRPAIRRAGTTLAPTPHKPHLTVEEWENLTPLSSAALKSVASIKSAGEKAPLPLKFVQDDQGSASGSRSSTPTLIAARSRLLGQGGSRPGTPSRLQQLNRNHLIPKQAVQTPQQFYDWLGLIDRSIAHSQESHYRAHVADVAEHLDACDKLVEIIDCTEREVNSMMEGWTGVEDSGKSLKDACERLLDDRDSLLALTDEIEGRLQYFQELEHATRMLNHPGDSLVLQTDFLYMVERVDISIDYLRDHKHFKEAEVYLLRFQQCLTRAMTLIKMFFVGSLRALSADIAKRMSDNEVSSTAQTHLLYTRFRSVSQQLAPLLGELERRAKAHPDELSSLLSECHSAYFSTRKSLLVGRLTEEIRGLDPSRTELVELTRAGCSYLKELCVEEFELFREFFNSGEDQLYPYLENLCDYLYDDLRPRILHEPRLTALCEVCTVLQALMLLDVPSSYAADRSSDSDSDSVADSELELDLQFADEHGKRHSRKFGLGKLHISQLLEMVLQDAQTRLFFKAQSVIQSDIRYYVPKPADLAYPAKLLDVKKATATGLEIKEKESIGQIFQRIPSLDKQDTWYPTLRKTVWVLSQLHDFVKPVIFDDIAQEAVALCRASLVSASETIISRSTPQSPTVLDGQLFLIRHLFILKEIAQNLDSVMTRRDGYSSGGQLDSGVTDALSSVLNRTTSLLPSALFASLGMPKKEEGIHEARDDIDQVLKKACEDVIATMSTPASRLLAPQPSLTPLSEEQVPRIEQDFRAFCEGSLKGSIARVWMYLEDDGTVRVLLGHVRERIEDAYDELRFANAKALEGGSVRLMSGETVRTYLRGVFEAGGGKSDLAAGSSSSG